MTQIDCVVHFYMDFYSTNSTFFLVFLDHILPSTFSPGYHCGSSFDLLIYAQKKPLEIPISTAVRNINFRQLFFIFLTLIIRTIKNEVFGIRIIFVVVETNQ